MPTPTGPLIDDPRRLLLDMAREHSMPALLRLVVDRLASSPRVALARIWLVQPSRDRGGCPFPDDCRDRTACLHLAAGAGRSIVRPGVEWTRLDGAFRRFPLGVRKVGQIAAAGEPIEAFDLLPAPPGWAAEPGWMRAEGISAFGGQPLIHRGEVLGVLGVFARGPVGSDCMEWLRAIADGAAAAIATARAFERIADLSRRLEQENEYLREEVTRAGSFGEMVGGGPALEGLGRQIDLVAPTDAAVLILGESGTGKELVAREVHRRSGRAARPLIKVNCAAVPRELYESEFFGHARGAFTGALRDRVGRFELADGGTLFLDEVGEIPLELQAKLLRVLQEGELERVGEERTRKVAVRLIAATNRDLRAEAEAGRFRQDLYYRLSVFPIALPPLRHRVEDIPPLAEHFLDLAERRLGRPRPRLTLADLQRLQRYAWPGNVRELQHVIERAVIISDGARLTLDLPAEAAPRREAPALADPTRPDRRRGPSIRGRQHSRRARPVRRQGLRPRRRRRVARDEANHPRLPDQGDRPVAPGRPTVATACGSAAGRPPGGRGASRPAWGGAARGGPGGRLDGGGRLRPEGDGRPARQAQLIRARRPEAVLDQDEIGPAPHGLEGQAAVAGAPARVVLVYNRLRWGGASYFGAVGRGSGDPLLSRIADGWDGKPLWGRMPNTWIKYVAR